MKFTLKENQITLNALQLDLDGFVQLDGDNVNIDLKYAAPQNNFKSFLSLIPSAYTSNFADVQANGSLQFSGFVKGNYNALSNQIPAFMVDLNIANADIKYPDLPLGISKINTQTKINSPSSDFDEMTIDVSKFNMEMGWESISRPFSSCERQFQILIWMLR